jgi:hypothetical protein
MAQALFILAGVAIGKAGGFAVFPDYETGRKTIFSV